MWLCCPLVPTLPLIGLNSYKTSWHCLQIVGTTMTAGLSRLLRYLAIWNCNLPINRKMDISYKQMAQLPK